MQRPGKLALLGFACCGVIFFLMQKRAKHPSNIESITPASTAVAVPSKRLKAAALVAEPKSKLSQEARDTKAGFAGVGYTIDDQGNNNLKVTVKTSAVCHPGDYEAMSLTVGNGGGILLSLEALGAGKTGVKPATRLLSMKEIFAGVTVDLPVKIAKGGLFGLFLCADAAKAGSCLGKKPADFNAIFNRSDHPGQGDSLFYFQFTVIKPKSALVYGGSARGMPGAREDLADQDLGGKALEQDIKQAATLMRGVRSLPPVTAAVGDNTAVVIPVAMLEGKNCGGPASALAF